MNQKEAIAAGLCYGSANAQKVLKRIRAHVLWSSDLTMDERKEFDRALRILDPLGQKYQAKWDERCRQLNEEWRRRQDERQGKAA